MSLCFLWGILSFFPLWPGITAWGENLFYLSLCSLIIIQLLVRFHIHICSLWPPIETHQRAVLITTEPEVQTGKKEMNCRSECVFITIKTVNYCLKLVRSNSSRTHSELNDSCGHDSNQQSVSKGVSTTHQLSFRGQKMWCKSSVWSNALVPHRNCTSDRTRICLSPLNGKQNGS